MVKYARRVANTAPLKDMIVKELNPGLEVQTDEQWAGTSDLLLTAAIRDPEKSPVEWLKATFSTTWRKFPALSGLDHD